jgi:O-antigen/teichoic acid export membrane protein
MIVAVFSIPILIRGLGKDRFGVLTLAWALIGYASLFDLGLGRALTQLVAKKLGAGEHREVPTAVWTSLGLMLLLGMLGTAVVVMASPWLVHRVLNVPEALQHETLGVFYLLGLSVPLVITTAGLRGVLEAHQHFGLINALRVPMGVYTFASPLMVLPFSRSLLPVVIVLVVGRLLAWAAHLVLCLRAVPAMRRKIAWEAAAVGPLLRLGGWMTVSNTVSPLMVTLDRFLVGAMVSMTAVAYYATPYEIITKLLAVPAAVMGVMFPAFSTSFVQDRARTAVLYGRCIKYLFLILFPVVLLTVVLAKDGLTLWLGADFAQHSFRVLQWLAVGVFLNSLAQVPFTLLQGGGRPDLTAKLHLIELPLYLLGLWWLISHYGIEGVAIAWTARMGVDALALFVFSQWLLPESVPAGRQTTVTVTVALAVLLSATLPATPTARLIFLSAVLMVFLSGGWFLALVPEERALIGARLKPFQVSFHGD